MLQETLVLAGVEMRSSPRKMRGEEVEENPVDAAAAKKRKARAYHPYPSPTQANAGVLQEAQPDGQQNIIGGTIDELKNNMRGKKEVKDENIVKDMMVEDMVMEEEEQVVPLQQERVAEGEYIIEQQGEEVGEESYTIHTQQFTDGEEDVQFEQDGEEEDEAPSLTNMRYKIGGGGEADGGQQMVVQVLPKAVCKLEFPFF